MRSVEPMNPKEKKKITDLPISCSDELMELRFALLTVIKLWAHGLVGKAHTAPVLPYMAVVALNEKVPNIIRQSVRRVGVVDLTTTVLWPSFWGAALGKVTSTGRRTRIFSMSTDASRYVFFDSLDIFVLFW
jgi:hypothetical protein